MATLCSLSAFPVADSGAINGMVFTDNVNKLRDWVWNTQVWRISFDLSFFFGTGTPDPVNLGIGDHLAFSGTHLDSFGATITPAFGNEKEMLNYRPTIQDEGFIHGTPDAPGSDRQYDAFWSFGDAIKWNDVFRDDGTLITSGGDYGFFANITVLVVSEVLSGRCSTQDLGFGGIDTLDAFNFDGVTQQLFKGADDQLFTGTITVTRETNWTFQL